MRLVFLGPPGCGKGTQAKLLCQKLEAEHIGTGDLLRVSMRTGTPAGIEAARHVDQGNLVPDQVVNDLIAERFARVDRPARFILDGYPRTLPQAMACDTILAKYNLSLDGVVLISVPDREIVRRVSGRWSCPLAGCKATYHVVSNPPRLTGICDDCGTHLVQRSDDAPGTVEARLLVYHRDTEPLLPYYRAKGLLRFVDGTEEISQVGKLLRSAIGE